MTNKKTYPLTIYLIKESVTEFSNCVEGYADEFEIGSIGKLYYDQSRGNTPKWATLLNTADLGLFSSHASAVLLVKSNNRIFALTFGPKGRHFLKKGVIVERFGLKVTLNTVKEDSIRSIQFKNLETEGFQSTTQSAKPIETRDFGLDLERDLVSNITGVSEDHRLLGAITGKDALHISVKCDLNDIKPLLAICLEQSGKIEYQERFPWIDNIKETNDVSLIEQLDNELIEKINAEDLSNIWLTVPDMIDWTDHGGFKFSRRKREDSVDDIHLPKYKEFLEEDATLESLKNDKVTRWTASNDLTKDRWRVYDCIYFENRRNDNSIFYLTNGKWYEIKNEIIETTNQYWESIQKDEISINFIEHNNSYPKELDYNRALASSNNAICLDQKNIQIHGYSKFEFCDVYTQDKKIIHVKKYSGSSALSHLFNQGLVSAEFLFDPNFRIKINEKISELNPDLQISDITNRPNTNDENYSVVFAIISGSQNELDIPFFSKIALQNVHKNLLQRGFRVSVVKIQNTI